MNTDTQTRNNPPTQDCDSERAPTLAARFCQLFDEHIAPETGLSSKDIIGYSIPLRLLRRFSIVECLKCYLCQSEDEYDPPEGTPIMAWSMNYIAIIVDNSIYGCSVTFSVISSKSSSWWAQQQERPPNIEDVGKTIILE